KIGCRDFRHNNFLALRPAQRGISGLQDFIHRIVEPALMAKLKSKPVRLRKYLGEGAQQLQIDLQIWRRLHQNRSQLARLAHRLQALQKKAQRLVSVLQSLEMSNGLMDLGGKAELL